MAVSDPEIGLGDGVFISHIPPDPVGRCEKPGPNRRRFKRNARRQRK